MARRCSRRHQCLPDEFRVLSCRSRAFQDTGRRARHYAATAAQKMYRVVYGTLIVVLLSQDGGTWPP